MTTKVLKNAYISIDGNDVSEFVDTVSLSYEADTLDNTTMGQDTHINIAGLKNFSASFKAKQDYSDNGLDEILFYLVGADPFALAIRPENEAASATNPEFGGNVVMKGYDPIAGKVGDLVETSPSFVPAGSLSRGVGA